ncbi:MAG: DNA-binding protein [Phycisphaerales bacterium]|nr:DNA-binding protein [Phycisphaerales bacterium]
MVASTEKSNRDRSRLLRNDEIAARMEEVADLLERQQANVFRVQAYRTAARTLRRLARPVVALIEEEGLAGLQALPGIGVSLARSIDQLAHTGNLTLLNQLRGHAGPESVFTTVPGLGPELADRIHDVLGLETLAELEMAAHDGRLATVPGMGRRRIQAIRESLAGRFRRQRPIHASRAAHLRDEPPVAELIDIDREYRAKAAADRLLRIAPKRFNPTGEAWLPILHTHRGDRHYTALYSNTARAHTLGTTRDWVVIYRDDHGGRGQWTIVTARSGALRDRRVVRGREAECLARERPSEMLWVE